MHSIQGLLVIAACCSFAGCGQSALAPVNGTVKYQDQPLTVGTVAFKGEAGGAMGYGSIQSDGSYAIKTGNQFGLAPGNYRVSVVATETQPIGDRKAEPAARQLTPARYASPETSGLTYFVPSGGGTFDIVLTDD